MRKLFIIVSLIAVSSCSDEDMKDPFIGSWEYRFMAGFTSISFDINNNSNTYQLKNVVVDNEQWMRYETRDVSPKSKIGMLVFSETSASYKGCAFFNCTLNSDGNITADSVWVYPGALNVKHVYYSQVITKTN